MAHSWIEEARKIFLLSAFAAVGPWNDLAFAVEKGASGSSWRRLASLLASFNNRYSFRLFLQAANVSVSSAKTRAGFRCSSLCKPEPAILVSRHSRKRFRAFPVTQLCLRLRVFPRRVLKNVVNTDFWERNTWSGPWTSIGNPDGWYDNIIYWEF